MSFIWAACAFLFARKALASARRRGTLGAMCVRISLLPLCPSVARRALSTASIGWSSSITFATLGTAITTLVLVPGLNVLFTVLLGADLAANDTVRIGCATALIATLQLGGSRYCRARRHRPLDWVSSSTCVGLRPLDAGYWFRRGG